MKKVIGICRYSVITHENKKDWIVGGKDVAWQDYKDHVLDRCSLRKKFSIFRSVTLPSISGSVKPIDCSWFRLIVLISFDMPEEERFNLEKEAEKYSWCKVVPVKEDSSIRAIGDEEVLKFVGKTNEVYATFRIDDDDGLSKDFFNNLAPYIDERFLGHAISFPKGVNGLYDGSLGGYTVLKKAWHYYIGLGLSLISRSDSDYKHVLYKKNHLDIDRRHPTVIVPTRDPMFLRTFHEDSDLASGNKKRLDNFIKKNPEDQLPLSVLEEFFTLDTGGVSCVLLGSDERNIKKLESFILNAGGVERGLIKTWYYRNNVLVFDYSSPCGFRYAFDVVFSSGSVALNVTARDDVAYYNVMKFFGGTTGKVSGNTRSRSFDEWERGALDEVAKKIIYHIHTVNSFLQKEQSIPQGGVAAYWWDMKINFGDLVGPWIIEILTKRPVYNTIGSLCHSEAIMSAGSIITGMQRPGMSVWGSGLIAPLNKNSIARLKSRKPEKILAVRGELTRRELMEKLGWEVPEVYGDPALLLPYFFTPKIKRPSARSGLSVIPHYIHSDVIDQSLVEKNNGHLIGVQREAEQVVSEIALSDVVISTSLHGVILAQAYNVPWVWLRIIDKDLVGNDFKFEDFFSILERDQVAIFNTCYKDIKDVSFSELAEIATLPKSYFDPDKLIGSFPLNVSGPPLSR